jgi:hypothetical protein
VANADPLLLLLLLVSSWVQTLRAHLINRSQSAGVSSCPGKRSGSVLLILLMMRSSNSSWHQATDAVLLLLLLLLLLVTMVWPGKTPCLALALNPIRHLRRSSSSS